MEGSRVSGLGLLGFRVSGFGFRVSGFGFRVSGSAGRRYPDAWLVKLLHLEVHGYLQPQNIRLLITYLGDLGGF